MAEEFKTTVTQITGSDAQGKLVFTTNYSITNKDTNFTSHQTPSDVPYFPGSLNKSADGKTLLTPFSSEEELLASAVKSSNDMGVPHPTEIKPVFNDPDFPASLASPMGFNPDNPTEIVDRKAFLAKLIARAEDENFDPSKIIGLNHELDKKSFLPDLNPLSLIGDPRWSLGSALQSMYQNVLPQIDTWLKTISPEATYINSMEQICDKDGNPIQTPGSMPIISYDVNGNVVYNIPQDYKLPKPPTAKEMKQIFIAQKDKAFKDHADAFVRYLRKRYLLIPTQLIQKGPPTLAALAWSAELIFLDFAGFFFVKLVQQIVKKHPPQEVVIIDEFEAEAFKNKGRNIFGGRGGQIAVDPSITGIIGPVPKVPRSMELFTNDKNDNNVLGRKPVTYYYAYRYIDNYVRVETTGAYNPYNIPEREDPEAPAPPAKPAVYDNRGFLVKPAYPKGKPGTMEVVDIKLETKRYYPDQKEYLAEQLGIGITHANNLLSDQKHINSLMGLSAPIPDYTTMD